MAGRPKGGGGRRRESGFGCVNDALGGVPISLGSHDLKTIVTATLEIAYEEYGPEDGYPVVLMHGFPDDVHAYDGVAPPLADSGRRVIIRPSRDTTSRARHPRLWYKRFTELGSN